MAPLARLSLALLGACAPLLVLAATPVTPAAPAAAVVAPRLADGVIAPFSFERCCGNIGEIAPNPSAPDTQAIRLHWSQANYRNNRESRGIEVVGPRVNHNEQWFGFRFRIPSEFPADQRIILAQLICWERTAETNKTLSVSLHGPRLSISGYFGDKTGLRNPTRSGALTARGVLTDSLPRDQWIDLVIHARLSNQNTGFIHVWLDGAPAAQPTFSVTGINLGDAHFDGPDQPRFGAYPKAGMYCWDAPNYVPGETRELWLDSLALIAGPSPDGHRLVSPANRELVALTPDPAAP